MHKLSFHQFLASFAAHQSGNIAVMFGLGLLPIVVTAGGAIDFAGAMEKKTSIQNALDAGVLSAAVNQKQSAAYLQQAVNANLRPKNISVTNATLSAVTAADGGALYAGDASFAVTTNFLKMIGLPNITVSAHAEAKIPGQVITATFTPTNAQGAFAKDIFLWTKNAAGAVTSRQTVLSYRYSPGGGGVTTPPIGTQTVTFTVPAYTTYGLGMVAYQDLTYSGQLINPAEMWTDAANASSFIHQTGACSNASGATYNWEDGGDGNYLDFVYNMKCTNGVVPGSVAHLSK